MAIFIFMFVQCQILESEKQLLKAMLSSDVLKLDSLIHDDLIFFNHLGMVFTKQMDLDACKSGTLKLDSSNHKDIKIMDFTDCALVNAGVEMTGDYLEQSFKNQVRFIRTWKKYDMNWKIISGSSFLIS